MPSVANAATVPDHFLTIEYRLGLQREHLVNPKVGIIVLVRAQVRDTNRQQQVHQATWAYCGERYHFVQMAANNAAALRAQIDQAAAVLAEAIPYDLYVSKQPRHLLVEQHLHGLQRPAERQRAPRPATLLTTCLVFRYGEVDARQAALARQAVVGSRAPASSFSTTCDSASRWKQRHSPPRGRPALLAPAYWKAKTAGVPSSVVPSACGAKRRTVSL